MKKTKNTLWQVLAIIALVGFVAIACDNGTTPNRDPGGKTALSTPANVRVDDAGKTAFNLKWDAVQGADKYELDIGGVLQQVSDSTVSYDLKALTFDPKVYPIRVRALAANGDEAYKDSAYSVPLNVEPAEYIFTTDGVSLSPSIRFSRNAARSAGGDGLTITGLTPYGQGLETIVIPPKIGSVTVTTIGASAFAGTDITSIKLPDTVTEILAGAFSNCPVLVIVVFVSVEPPAMANDVFEGSNALETIIVPEGSGSAYAETIDEAAPALAEKIEEARPEPFAITINAANGGRITTNPSGNALAGTSVMITVSPNSGYTFNVNSLRVTDANNKAVNFQQNTSGGYTFTMPASDVTVSGSFTQNSTGGNPGGSTQSYKININAGSAGGGDITTNPQGNAMAGTTVTINISVNSGYQLASIKVTDSNNKDVNLQPNNASGGYTFTMPASDVTVSGSFTQNSTGGNPGGSTQSYKINTNTGSSGTASGGYFNVNSQAEAGATVTFFVIANSGYTFNSSTLKVIDRNGKDVIYQPNTSGGYFFTMPASDVTISATFTQNSSGGNPGGSTQSYKINVNTGSAGTTGGGSITTNPQGNASAGTSVTINVYPDSGYTLASLSVLDAKNNTVNYQTVTGSSTGGDAYSFTMPSSDVTISGSFTEKK
jgi:hypothetical protein